MSTLRGLTRGLLPALQACAVPGPKSTARWPHQRLGWSHSKNALMP